MSLDWNDYRKHGVKNDSLAESCYAIIGNNIYHGYRREGWCYNCHILANPDVEGDFIRPCRLLMPLKQESIFFSFEKDNMRLGYFFLLKMNNIFRHILL